MNKYLSNQKKQTTAENSKIILVSDTEAYRRASANDMIKLKPVPGSNALIISRFILDALVHAVVSGERLHLTGPTGVAKTALMNALPLNLKYICMALGLKYKPLTIKHIEASSFETPGEVFQRRAIKNGNSYDEDSILIEDLRMGEKVIGGINYCIYIKEIGRMNTAQALGGILNAMEKNTVVLPNGESINVRGISWVADSNYAAEHEGSYNLHKRDDAVMRRFGTHIYMGYLSKDQEILIIKELTVNEQKYFDVTDEWIDEVVQLGNLIRQEKIEGNLATVIPPTIDGYLSFLAKRIEQPYLETQQIAEMVFFGAASMDERNQLPAMINQLFGISDDEDMEFEDVSFM